MSTIAKWIGYFFIAYVILSWLTSGQDEIIEGPPETPETVYVPTPATP